MSNSEEADLLAISAANECVMAITERLKLDVEVANMATR